MEAAIRNVTNGKVLNCVITSPRTGAQYDLVTGRYVGKGLSPLQSSWLKVFPVQVAGDDVYIRVAP